MTGPAATGPWAVEHRGAVAVCTFLRPPRNEMDIASLVALEAVLTGLAADESVSVVVLTGGLPGFFVAHADTAEVAAFGRGEGHFDAAAWHRAAGLLESIPQPTVAAIDGQAWGGGYELALACTVRIASARSHVALPEVSVGIIPGAGGTQRLARLVGTGRAASVILTGRRFGAAEALAMGLLDAVLDDNGFADAALAWVGRMSRWGRPALAAAKQAIVQGTRLPFGEGLALEGRLSDVLMRMPSSSQSLDAATRANAASPTDSPGGAS